MNIEYHTSISQKTWTIESSDPTKTITCGFWIKETVDRPFGSGKEGDGIKEYSYAPLSNATNIRLLCLQPGRDSEPLRGSLIETKSKDSATSNSTVNGFNDKYEALSYTWGDSSKRTKMSLDGFTISITTSLEAALLHLRSPDSEQILWIDQICINQYDYEEKAVQVAQMLRVYAAAERVHVWVGPSTENSKVGMMLLQQLCDSRQVDGDPSWKDLPPDMVRAGIDDIVSRPWFHRIWVVQEAAVAREVIMHCGRHHFSWRNTIEQVRFFSRAIKMAVTLAAWAETHLEEVNMDTFLQVLQRQLDNGPENARYKANLPALDLLDIAYDLRNRVTVNPRDRIYAVLGFADEETRQKLMPDYSIPVEVLFNLFEQTLLYGTSDQPHRSEDIPQSESRSSRRGMSSEPGAESWNELDGPWEFINDQHDELEHVRSSTTPAEITVGNSVKDIFTSSRKKLQRLWPLADSNSRIRHIISLGRPTIS